jgi:disease resistance protein RPM1
MNPVATLDPRITNLYADPTDLVGINNARKELVLKLTKGDDMSMQKQRIVSIVGFGGLGKTMLAKAVYDEIKLHGFRHNFSKSRHEEIPQRHAL